jgi:hypothetical protein
MSQIEDFRYGYQGHCARPFCPKQYISGKAMTADLRSYWACVYLYNDFYEVNNLRILGASDMRGLVKSARPIMG